MTNNKFSIPNSQYSSLPWGNTGYLPSNYSKPGDTQ